MNYLINLPHHEFVYLSKITCIFKLKLEELLLEVENYFNIMTKSFYLIVKENNLIAKKLLYFLAGLHNEESSFYLQIENSMSL